MLVLITIVGNGGVDKLIGVCNTDEATASIYADSELDYVEVEEIG